jgi:hypothetical protein
MLFDHISVEGFRAAEESKWNRQGGSEKLLNRVTPMLANSRASRVRLLSVLCICLLAIASATSYGQQAPDKGAQPPSPPDASAAPPAVSPAVSPAASPVASSEALQYVGAQTCKACHEDLYNGWEKSAHWQQTYKEGGIAKHGCEDCRGRRRQNEDFHFWRTLDQRNQRQLPDLPRQRCAAHECNQLGAFKE